MSTRMASKRFSSEKSSVLTKEALADLNLHEFDILPNWEPTSGKIYTKVRAISARINQNFDGWPSKELKKSYRTFLGKPVFVNHVNDDPRKARGVVVAARFVESGDDKYIEVIQEVDADKFPKLAHELISGGLDSVSMGAEARICKCSYCGNEASDMLSMCSHVLSKKGQVLGRINDDGTREDVLVYEECRDVSFFELSYVFDPADETAVVSNVLTANRKRGYGETSLPPQVDTLRDEEEDLAGYFIDPPREFQEPDLDEEYPAVEEGQPLDHRRDEEQREDVQMTRVSRVPRNRRNADSNINRVRDTGIDFPSLVGLEEGDWEGYERDFVNKQRSQGDLPPVLDYIQDNAYGRPTKDWEGNLPDEVIEYNPRQSNRRGRNMSHNRRARRRYAEEFGRNDQGEQEEVFISQTPPAEPVETGEGASDAPNNTKSDRVKTDQNRSTHTNLEARRRRARALARRRGSRRKKSYNPGEEVFFYTDEGIDPTAVGIVDKYPAVDPEGTVHEDLVQLRWMEDDGEWEDIVETNHLVPAGPVRNALRRSNRRRVARGSGEGARHVKKARRPVRFMHEPGTQGSNFYAPIAVFPDSWDENGRSFGPSDGGQYKILGPSWQGEDNPTDLYPGSIIDNWEETEDMDWARKTFPSIFDNDDYEIITKNSSNRSRRRARRRMAEQSDDFDLNSRADIARDVEDDEVFILETGPQTQPKDASRRRSRRKMAGQFQAGDEIAIKDDPISWGTVLESPAVDDNGNAVPGHSLIEWGDTGEVEIVKDEFMALDQDYKTSRRRGSRRRMADTNLDLAAPDGRVNVEAPVKNVTDEEAQASQFDKKDYGHNAGDHLADPDLSTDQNWAPGEGPKTSARASEIEGMRLAEAMVEAGLEAQEDRWKLAEAYTKLPANIVRDRIALLARTASAKSAVRDDKSQRPVKSARKAPGLGQRPTLQKSANKSDDYTLYL